MTFRNTLPNLFTLGNLFCGYFSIVQSYNDNYYTAAVFILLASVFDAFDGKVARWMGSTSDFGAELDSICDVVSFGLAPSILIYQHEFASPPFGMPAFLATAIAFLPAMGGALRLARFNIMMRGKTEHKKYFMGMPIPAAANTIAAYVLFSGKVDSSLIHTFAPFLIIVVSGLMVTRIRYDSIPKLTWNQNMAERIKLVILLIGIILFFALREIAFFPIMLFYLLSGLIRAGFNVIHPVQPSAGGAAS